MGNKIDNDSAREFALAFYESLAFGRDYATAFRFGYKAIDLNHMPDSDQPIAFLPGMKTSDASIARQTSSISGRKQRSELPKSTSLESVKNEQVVSVKLWYGTNRKPNDTLRLDLGFSNDRDDKINFGTCEVAVPRRRAVGSLGSWAWYRWLTWNDDRVKLDWKSLVKYEPISFWKSLQQSVKSLEDGKKHAVVFIHGFNVSFKDAALRTAQLAVDLPLPGPATFFSWPSRGYMLGYAADEATIRYTEKYLIEFLTNFVQQSGAERIHLIAHSMGNRGLLDAMDKVIAALKCEKPFDQVILAAPDVDLGEFGQKAEIYARAAKQTTLY
ncbi:MAG: alpha/beta hydrolase, partial [Pirellula sp.]